MTGRLTGSSGNRSSPIKSDQASNIWYRDVSEEVGEHDDDGLHHIRQPKDPRGDISRDTLSDGNIQSLLAYFENHGIQ